MSSENVFKIFIDFDGTITTRDVGDAIFTEFGDAVVVNKIIEDLLSDKISSKQCWLELCKSVGSINEDDLKRFINGIEVDPTFTGFVEYCEQNKLDYFVLSDGFDYYVNQILERENIHPAKVYANTLAFSESSKLVPSFPYYDESCLRSANCKRNHLINHSADSEQTVYIGDGNSDKDIVEYCDFVFAKNDLLKYCEQERITFFPFNNFDDIQAKIEKLRLKKNLKKRVRASLKRNEAYKAE